MKNNEETSTDEENKSGISSDLIRGHINTIILRTLYERDKYGYEIIEEIENKSHGQYTLKQPTLYSALKRLESQGYINAYWKTDEVSNGGRRKYYTLTDSGREITEKNQSEWEYSRTVIDSLISDRNFDFTQPPPSSVDFKILKTSTSRVPTVKNDDEKEQREVKYDAEVVHARVVRVEEYTEPEPIQEIIAQPVVNVQPIEPVRTIVEEPVVVQPKPIPIVDAQNFVQPQPIVQQQPVIQQQPVPSPEPTPEQLEEERRRHENYLKLISEPVAVAEEVKTNPVSDNIDTEKLIYNKKPETERDYKNIIDGLFVRTISNQPKQREKKPAERYVEYEENAIDNSDGLTVNSSDFVISASRRKKYNRGIALFKSSLIVAVLMLVEFALSLAFKDALGISVGYSIVILALGVAQVLIFGILTTTDFGKSTRKPASHSYLTTSVVLAIITIMVIFVVALLLDVKFTSFGDVAAKFLIPSFVALNIPIFSTVFYLFSK
ncbi:MAG: PadR family transcriptional regulator [Clostridia bacterium]|nr:PadR family transcriptional regulator [Clostridia bacterium]